jgi:hypothetical protein
MAADKDRSGDVVWAVIAAALFGVPAIILGAAADAWDRTSAWLLEHHVLAPAAGDPVLEVPGSDGAGLDGARIAVALGALAAVSLAIGLTYSGRRRRGASSRYVR